MKQTIKKTVLIIEGNPAARASLQEAITVEGYAVEAVATGREGVERVQEHCPDAVILEERLAEMSGIETLRKLQQIKPGLPVVMLTRRGTIGGAVEAMKAGACDYFLKPPELARFMLCIREAVGAIPSKGE